MKINTVFTTIAFTFASISIVAPAVSAEAHPPVSIHAYLGKPHTIKLTLFNNSQNSMTLKSEEGEWTLQPGRGVDVKLMEGDKVIAENATPDHAAGSVILEAQESLDGATVRIR